MSKERGGNSTLEYIFNVDPTTSIKRTSNVFGTTSINKIKLLVNNINVTYLNEISERLYMLVWINKFNDNVKDELIIILIYILSNLVQYFWRYE
jgi:hypothetical protein